MNITVTGASGFLGKPLIERLRGEGHDCHWMLGWHPVAGVQFSAWDSLAASEPPAESLAAADAVIHLAGEPVGQRWTAEAKRRIRESRVEGTRTLVRALAAQARRPAVLISGSAIGIYGDRGEEVLTESSALGHNFLAEVCAASEQESGAGARARNAGSYAGTGIVLGKGGGAVEKMLPPFRAGLGGPLGSGKQWMSWIHLEDLIGLIVLTLQDGQVSGALNGTAPQPVTNATFTSVLARTLHRPAILPAPRFGLKLLFGEMADMLLASQRVLPKAALNAGYRFQFQDLGAALEAVVGT